jgi:uncharacterized phage protein (TIGR01671 family)
MTKKRNGFISIIGKKQAKRYATNKEDKQQMREIKYRAKRVDNGEWVYGYVAVHTICGDETELKTVIVQNPDKIYQYESWIVDPQTVGQFVGMADNNDREIYEGDICLLTNTYKGANSKSTVEIAFEGWGFVGKWSEEESPTGYMYNPLRSYNFPVVLIEVIGNIHDNPELREEAAC